MELWTDGAPLIFKSDLLRHLKFEDGGAPDLNQPPNGTPFLEPVESVPILKGPKKGSEIRTRFRPRFHAI